jgi:hypothetical protein
MSSLPNASIIGAGSSGIAGAKLLAEAARYLRGEYHLPPDPDLRTDMERERERMFKRYVKSKRHTMQVDFDDYLLELRRGGERARRVGFVLPVPARAAHRWPLVGPAVDSRGSPFV